ncbi:cysteine synthase A [Elusimicrobium posterum]|uniref:cysteine synthase A n=1 Tax=Elusimicrobium posterum TaxID=3116653 RepID=UPI003C73FC5C
MSQALQNITAAVGNTPLLRINKINIGGARIFAKLEMFNPLSSVKDRVALSIINDAERTGRLKEGGVIVEASSGNTGIGLAFIAAQRGYKLILTMPESVSTERRKILKALGATLELTEGPKGMKGAIAKAQEILAATPGAFYADQFGNPANPLAHKQSTGPEIEKAMGDDKVDFFVSGVGTGGTLTGAGEYLKSKYKDMKIVAVEPSDSPVLSGGAPAPHKLQGIGAGFVPDVLKKELIDEIILVKTEDAFGAGRRLASSEGVFCGITSGAAMHAALLIAMRPENKDKNIVVILPDTGERYISTDLWNI